MRTMACAAIFALAALSAGWASSAPTAGTAAPGASTAPLRWEVLTSRRPGLTRDLPPGTEELAWVANSATLIYGERDPNRANPGSLWNAANLAKKVGRLP